jgi:hypothetical protein
VPPPHRPRTRLDGLGDAKVDQLKLPLHHQEVGGLQVAVHDALAVDAVHGLTGGNGGSGGRIGDASMEQQGGKARRC